MSQLRFQSRIQNQQQSDMQYIQPNNKRQILSIDISKPFQHRQIDTRWIQLKLNNNNFISRSYFASCIQAGKVFIHGGYNQQTGTLDSMYEAQFYSLPVEWNQIKVNSKKDKNPPALRSHTLCAYKAYLILVGGQKSMLENNKQIYRFDLRTYQWEVVKLKMNNKVNLGIDSHVAFLYNDCMYLFGGYNADLGLYSNTLIKVNLENISNNQVQVIQVQIKNSTKPSPRGNFAATLCGDNYYIFGGTNSNYTFDDFWVFNFTNNQWNQMKKLDEKHQWPQKRKGQTMNYYQKYNSIFMFGGIKQITKQKNDMMVYLISKHKWVQIHKNTNLLYDPSPTLKKQLQCSPQIIQAKNRKLNKSNSKRKNDDNFRIGLKSVPVNNRTVTQGLGGSREKQSTKSQFYNKQMKTEYGNFSNLQSPQFKNKMSVFQQKKYRQFYNRKKKLLQQIHKHSKHMNLSVSEIRPHSPTSQTLIYSIDTIGEQKRQSNSIDDELPKVIFDEQKGAVIGKKPCARDGHTGLVHEDSIIIIGGDRHMISFKDVYMFKMDRAVQNIHLYQ